jgi:signal transduction histidine kinase/CheY-like chemotaxis protein
VSFNQNAVYKLSNSQLIWGTSRGALMFEPDAVLFPNLSGRIFFQDIIISGSSVRDITDFSLTTPVDELERISLKYDQNTLTLEILPIATNTISSRFVWMMEGIDGDWTLPSEARSITYASMPPGDYSLKIRMYDNSLRNLIQERSLLISITAPWWGSVWFRLLIFIIAASIFVLILRFYINRLRQHHAEDKIRSFTNMAHDICNSLTLINAPIEELNREENLSEEDRYYLRLASEQSEHLSSVTNQLLDFQKVDIGKEQIFLMMTDVVKVIEQRVLMYKASASKHKIEIRFRSNRESYLTALDELKIGKVVDNLLSNAIKYSYPDSVVEVNLSCETDKWTLEVKDYGLGISEDAQKKLFREFYRGDNVVNSTLVSSGIGLILVKKYVTMHEGQITLESKEKEGSLFRITIPFKEVSVKSPSLTLNGRSDDKHYSLPNSIDETTTEEGENGQSDDNGQKDYLLIVEDNEALTDFLQRSLRKKHKIEVAKDGKIAWDMIQENLPDLIIPDVIMPNMDGFELCRLIKSTYETAHIPVILLTTLDEKTEKLHGLGLGADDYLTKPFDITLLHQRISNIIQNRKIIRDKAMQLVDVDEPENEPIYLNELDDQFVKNAVSVVQANMDNSGFNKDTFASEMNVSPSLLYKKHKT